MNRRSFYTKRLGRMVAEGNNGFVRKLHVISGPGDRWAVVAEGNVRAVRSFTNQEEAIDFARSAAIATTAQIVIHGKLGQVTKTI